MLMDHFGPVTNPVPLQIPDPQPTVVHDVSVALGETVEVVFGVVELSTQVILRPVPVSPVMEPEAVKAAAASGSYPASKASTTNGINIFLLNNFILSPAQPLEPTKAHFCYQKYSAALLELNYTLRYSLKHGNAVVNLTHLHNLV